MKTNIDVKKVINVTIGRYYKAQFELIEDALKFVELGISGGADPADFKIYIKFYKEGDNKDVAEN